MYKDVSVVHPSLLSCLEPLESQQVRELLRRLGVHELEPQELLEQHIYPTIRNNKWKVTNTVNEYEKKKMISDRFFFKKLAESSFFFLLFVFTLFNEVKAYACGCELLGFHQAALVL